MRKGSLVDDSMDSKWLCSS